MATGDDVGAMTAEAKREMLARLLRERASRPREAPLSPGQRRIWGLQALDPLSPVYNICVEHRLEGPLDAHALEAALRGAVARHDALRARVEARPGGPVQVVAPGGEVVLERAEAATEEAAGARARADASAPLDPGRGLMHRFTLVRVSDRIHVLVATIHHIACDRWSLGILSREVGALYAAALGDGGPAPGPVGSYLDFAERQGGRAGGEAALAQASWWAEKLSGDVPALVLPGARGPSRSGYRGGREEFVVDAALLAGLGALGLREGATPSAVLLAAFAETLRRRTGQEDLVLCAPIAGRHRPEDRGTVGYFNNLLPLRLDLAGRPEFRELVGRVARESKEAYERQDAPFQEVAALCRAPLARCVFSVQNTPGLALRLPGIASSYRDVPSGASNFDLSVFLEESAEGLVGLVDHKLDVLPAEEARRLSGEYRAVLAEVARDPSLRPAPPSASPSPRRPVPARPGPAARPRGELERLLATIWEEELGVRPIGAEDDFFELGGHSLAAARAFERLSSELGIDLPLATLMAAPTPRSLARAIVEGSPGWACLVPVKPSGSRPPLYFVHGGGGGVLSYHRLAGYLGADQPVWGLQAHGRPGGGPRRVEDMAEEYASAVVAHRPEGPLHLGGHSFGALIAYEMARWLRQRGREVGLVALIDYPGPGSRITWRDKLLWHRIALGQLEWGDRLSYLGSGLRWKVMTSPRVPGAAKRALLAMRRRKRKAASARLAQFEASQEALREYDPPPFQGRVTVLRASGGLPAVAKDPAGGWGASALGGVEVLDVSGTHMDMFKEPHVLVLAEALRGCLERAWAAGPAGAEGPPARAPDPSSVSPPSSASAPPG